MKDLKDLDLSQEWFDWTGNVITELNEIYQQHELSQSEIAGDYASCLAELRDIKLYLKSLESTEKRELVEEKWKS